MLRYKQGGGLTSDWPAAGGRCRISFGAARRSPATLITTPCPHFITNRAEASRSSGHAAATACRDSDASPSPGSASRLYVQDSALTRMGEGRPEEARGADHA